MYNFSKELTFILRYVKLTCANAIIGYNVI
jgi:hypothetical protein